MQILWLSHFPAQLVFRTYFRLQLNKCFRLDSYPIRIIDFDSSEALFAGICSSIVCAPSESIKSYYLSRVLATFPCTPSTAGKQANETPCETR